MRLPWRPDRDMGWLAENLWTAARHPGLSLQRISYNVRRFAADQAAAAGYYDYPERIIFLAGMALSGSTWIKNMLARIPGYYTRATPMPFEVAKRQDIQDSAFSRVPRRGYTLFKTHLNPTLSNLDCLKRNGVRKVIVSYRDLRDVVVSDYYRSLEFPDPYDCCGYVDYSKMGKEEAMACSIRRVADHFAPWIRDWMEIAKTATGDYHFVRFEDIKADPRRELQRMLEFYGIRLAGAVVDGMVRGAAGKGRVKDNMEQAKVLPAGFATNFRKGKVGGWKAEFSAANLADARRLLGRDLAELGYEAA